MTWFKALRRKAVPVPADVPLESGERALATAATQSGQTVIITSRRLFVTGGDLAEGKPWHLVDAGRWDPASGLLTVTWVDQTPDGAWHIEDPGGVPDALRDRVQASVVLVEQVQLDRARRARVVLRKDLTTGRMLAQTIIARGCDPSDPELLAATDEIAARLAEQVGGDA